MSQTTRDLDADQAFGGPSGVFRAIFERASVGMAQIHPSTRRFIRVNDAYCALTGFSEPELLAMTLDDLNHPDDREIDRQRIRTAAHSSDSLYESEKRYVRKDGAVIWVSASGIILRDDEGRAVGGFAVVQDITARKRTDDAIRENEQRLRRFIEHAPAALAMFDKDMRYLAASGRWKSERGLGDDILGRSHYDVIPEMPARWKALHQRALAGETINTKEDVITSGGRSRCVDWEAGPWYDAAGEIGGILIGAEDVSDRVLARQRVQSSEAQLRFVTDHAPAMLVQCDAGQRLVFANLPYAERFGLRPEDVVGKHVADVVGAEAYEQLRPFVESALAGAQAEFEEAVSYPYGLRWMRCTYTPQYRSDGTVAGFVAVIQDVTARHEAEEALRANDAKLQAFLDASPIALVRTTRDLRYRAVNAAYAKLIGRPADQIVGRTLSEVLGSAALAKLRPFLDRVAAGERVELEEEMTLPGSVEKRWIQALYTPERDSAGVVTGWVVAITNVTERRRTEAALRASERLQRLLAEVGDIAARITDVPSLMSAVGERIAWTYCISRCGFALVDAETGRLTVTDDYHGDLPSVSGVYPLERYAAYWKDEALAGQTVTIPDMAADPRTASLYETSLASLGVRSQVMVPLHRQGRWVAAFWVADRMPRQWSTDDVESMRLVGERVWSVIERTRAEDAVRAQEEHLRLVTDQAPVLLVHCDHEARYRFVNTPYTERFGLRPEEVVGRKIPDVLGTAAYATVEPYVSAALRGERIEFEQEIPYTYGTRWMHCTYVPQTGPNGRVSGFVAVIQDVTARRVAEETLRESEERFRATFENAAVGMAHVALDGTLVRVNDRLCTIFGYPREELGLRTLRQLAHPDDRGVDEEYVREVLSGERQTYSVDKRHILADGSIAWTTLTVSLVRTADAAPAYFIAIVEDITARKRAEEALRDSARHKDEFLAMLAHELRNPLAPIRTAAGLLATCQVDDPVVVRSRAVIERQVTHMARLLDDLLDVSRLSRGTLPLQRAPVRIGDILRVAIEVSAPSFVARKQHLTVEGFDDDNVLDADRERLTQVFANLLNNAANYSGQGAHIHIAVRRDGDIVSVSVQDPGIGIAPEMLDRIFELFTRTHAATEHAPGGLGIGLSLARRVVELHGGTIHVVSEGLGRGSDFIVRLPATPAPLVVAPLVPLPPAVVEPDVERRVLVVDDNADAADMLALLLSGVGCDVRTAYRGQMALVEAERFRPDLLLLDIGLPDVSGHEVCRRIRDEEWGRSMVIVAVTGWGQDADRQRSALAGFDRHLVKPVDHDEIIALARDPTRS